MLFTKKGPPGTEATLAVAVARAEELKITNIVVASVTGETVKRLLPLVPDNINVTCVTHHTGFLKPGDQEMNKHVRDELASAGVELLTTTHLLGGIDRAVENTFGGSYPGGLVAHTLRMLGQGTKVAVEIAVMALDAGLIPYGEDIVAIGGTGRGADTAIVIRPEHAKNFFGSKIKEIICKPRDL